MRIETADQIAVVADTDGGLLMQFGPTTVELSPAEAEAFVIALSDALPDTDDEVECDGDECADCGAYHDEVLEISVYRHGYVGPHGIKATRGALSAAIDAMAIDGLFSLSRLDGGATIIPADGIYSIDAKPLGA